MLVIVSVIVLSTRVHRDGTGVDQLTTGDVHSCVLNEASGEIVCWGGNFSGQLGYANTAPVGDDEFPLNQPAVNTGIVALQVAAGGTQSCALGNAGTVRCWGSGGSGQLGYGNINNVGDDEAPASAGNVPVGAAITEISRSYGTKASRIADLVARPVHTLAMSSPSRIMACPLPSYPKRRVLSTAGRPILTIASRTPCRSCRQCHSSSQTKCCLRASGGCRWRSRKSSCCAMWKSSRTRKPQRP